MNTVYNFAAVAGGLALTFASATAGAEEKVTFAEHVAPIIYQNCAGCHRAGDIAPMSLLSYDEVRPWAKSIQKQVVEAKTMPPWHATEAPHGLFKNDRRLTDEQIATIDAWVKQGARPGNLDEAPEPPVVPDGWRMGEPDYVLTYEPVEVPAEGDDIFRDLVAVPDFGEDKWVTAIEIRPSNRKVVHHVILLTPETISKSQNSIGIQGWLAGWAAGTDPIRFPEGTGRLMKAGEPVIANMHFHPYGEAGTDATQIGFHFADKEDGLKKIVNKWVINGEFRIPAGEASHYVEAKQTLEEDTLIMSVAPHMHFRGKDMTISMVKPDGTRQQLVHVPNYDFNWQTIYECAEPILAPKGTVIEVTGHFDNSTNNPANPDPTKDITWGPTSFDEMFIGIIDVVPAVDATAAQSGD